MSLLAGAGAAGVMADDAAAGIVTADVSGTATLSTPNIYFSYASGTISNAQVSGTSIRGNVSPAKGGGLTRIVAGMMGGAGSQVASPVPVASGSSIGPTNTWNGVVALHHLGNGGYWGVRFPAGGYNFNYGWVQVAYTPTGLTFGNGAVETTVNTPIAAGAVPEIDPASAGSAVSLVAGVLAMVEQRRRKRFAAAGSLAG